MIAFPLKTTLVLSLLSVGALAQAADNFIDFESLTGMSNAPGSLVPVGSRLDDQFSSLGVSFRSNAGYAAVVDLGLGQTPSGINGIGGTTLDGLLSYDSTSPIEINFGDPSGGWNPAATNFVSFRGDLIGDGSIGTMNVYNDYGILIYTDSQVDTGGNTFSYASSTENISRVDFVGSGTIAIDDLSFNNVVVLTPEPMSLIAIGMGSLIALRRRKATR